MIQRLDFSGFANGFRVQVLLDDFSVYKVAFHNFRNILRRDAGIEGAFGVNNHNRTEGAETEASGLNHLNVLFHAALCKLLTKLLDDGIAVRRSTSGTAADKNMPLICLGAFLSDTESDGILCRFF